MVLVSHTLDVPPELGRMTAKFNLRLPSDEELVGMVRTQAKAWAEVLNSIRLKRCESEAK